MTNPEPTQLTEPTAQLIVLHSRGAHIHNLVTAPDFAPTLGEQPATFGGEDFEVQVRIVVLRDLADGLFIHGTLQPNPLTCELCHDRHYVTVAVDPTRICVGECYCDRPEVEHFETDTHRLACPACRTGDYLLTITEPRWRFHS